MNTIEMLEQRKAGLQQQLETMRENERVLNRAAGIDESAAKAKQAAGEAEKQATELRKSLKDLKLKKAQAMDSSITDIEAALDMFLPHGNAAVSIDDETGKLSFAWNMERAAVPYSGLSGGQRVMFDAAMAHMLLCDAQNQVVVVEAAELGTELGSMLSAIQEANSGAQVIVNTCFPFRDFNEQETGWRMIRVEGGNGSE
jgi:seryl-tRNA synthetase